MRTHEAITTPKYEDDLQAVVKEAYKNLKQNPLALPQSPLAYTALVENCLLAGETVQNRDLRTWGMRALLRWGLDKMHPMATNTEPIINDPAWRSYIVLQQFYWEAKKRGEIADYLTVVESTVDRALAEALATVTVILGEELQAPGHLTERKKYFLRERYQVCTRDEQQLLRLLAIFRSALSLPAIQELALPLAPGNVQTALDHLVTNGLVRQEADTLAITIHPHLITHLLNWSEPTEQRRWHRRASHYFCQEHNYIAAANHAHAAGDLEGAANILIDHYRAIVEDGKIQAFYDLHKKFAPHKLSESTWMRLQAAVGQAALLVSNVEIAIQSFIAAQETVDPYERAQAFHYGGKAAEKIRFGKALWQYDCAIDLLTPLARAGKPRSVALLIQVYIDKAWLYIQESQDLAQAEANLNLAQTLIAADDHDALCLLYNAWSGLCGKRGDKVGKTIYLRKALLAANATHNDERLIMALHNLGQFYAFQRQPEDALDYLQQGLARANDIHHREWAAKCHQAMGVAYFFLTQYPAAIEHYRQAYDTYKLIGNDNWLGWVCYDLAEAQFKLYEYDRAQAYLTEGRLLARRVAAQDLLDDLEELGEQLSTTDEARHVLEFVDQHGKITNRECQELFDKSSATALRVLKELVEAKTLLLVPKGRSSYYQRPAASQP